MPAASRRVLTVVAGIALGLVVLGPMPLPAIADDPAPFGWANGAGMTADGHVETDEDRQQILGSITANSGANPTARSGSAGPAPQCVWKSVEQMQAEAGEETTAAGASDPFAPEGSETALYARVCDGQVVGWQWFEVNDLDGLLATATDDVRRRLPVPRPVLSPDPARGLVVKVATWFAVPAGQWAAVTGTAEALGLAVTVTATPAALVFDPGDGASPVSCAGPGQTFDPAAPAPAAAPACSYVYRDASTVAANGRTWPASLSVRWRVTWTATGGQAGALEELVTTTAVDVVVREFQAVEGNGS